MEKLLLYVIFLLGLGAVSPLPGRQYHFIYEKRSWSDARSYCRKMYSDLVTVDDSSVMSTLIKMADVKQLGRSTDAWIGFFDDVSSWRWSLSQEAFYQGYGVDYREWVFGEPSNSVPGEACSEIGATTGWNDISCDADLRPICVSVNGQSATFTLIQSAMTWTQAQSYCRTHYTDLASVRNREESDRVKATIPDDDSAWLGLFRDQWKWSDEAKTTYTHWARGQPNGPKENCVAANFGNSGYWEDWMCDSTKAFICHHDPVPFSKFEMKTKLVKNSILDLKDAAVLDDLLKKLKQMAKDRGVKEEIHLSWRNIFKEEGDQT